MQLVRPAPEHLAAYADALQRGWSPDTLRPAAALETLERLQADPDGFLRLTEDPQGLGPPITLPDGTQVPRLPGLVRWMWDEEGFAGSINLRWPKDLGPLPPHVLGHIGYTVVPWKRQRGYATQALALLLPLARAQGLRRVDITTDTTNRASQRVITANGGVLVEHFSKPAVHGGTPSLRFCIELAA
ncbi:MAG: GNAT family N-acetyltransferase [Rubrivivax sp.]|nr:GNAT family N-acetyltransferase [Rubrivivax sp.]